MRTNDSVTLIELAEVDGRTTVQPLPTLTRLKALRILAAMTQAELAERSGVARTTIIRLEAGEPAPLPSTVRKLARALHVRPAELFGEQP
jgi:transcriptional regulator with XRE-family HTH domain